MAHTKNWLVGIAILLLGSAAFGQTPTPTPDVNLYYSPPYNVMDDQGRPLIGATGGAFQGGTLVYPITIGPDGLAQFQGLVGSYNVTVSGAGFTRTWGVDIPANTDAIPESKFTGSTPAYLFQFSKNPGVFSYIKANFSATAAPGVTDDSGEGYIIGSVWIDVTADNVYVCADATIDAAVWVDAGAMTVTGGTNLGSYAQVFKQLNGANLEFRSIQGDYGITVTQNADDIEIDNSGVVVIQDSPGIVGGYTLIHNQAVGVTQLEQLATDANSLISVDESSVPGSLLLYNEGVIDCSPLSGATGSSICNGTSAHVSGHGKDMEFKGLLGGTDITTTLVGSDIVIDYTGTAANQGYGYNATKDYNHIGTATDPSNTMFLGNGETHTTPVDYFIIPSAAITTSDQAGADLTLSGGGSTGDAFGGQLILRSGGVGSPGATQNIPVVRWILTTAGHLVPQATGSYDIGDSSSSTLQPRFIHVNNMVKATFGFEGLGLVGVPATGTDTAGVPVYVAGGTSTGSGTGGDIIFQTSPIGPPGSTPNTATSKWKIDAQSGSILPIDNISYDIGNPISQFVRNIYSQHTFGTGIWGDTFGPIAATGTDNSGTDNTIHGGQGTGTGVGGKIMFQTSDTGISSSTPNSSIDRWEVSNTGDFLPQLDDAYDVGSAALGVQEIFADTFRSSPASGDSEIELDPAGGLNVWNILGDSADDQLKIRTSTTERVVITDANELYMPATGGQIGAGRNPSTTFDGYHPTANAELHLETDGAATDPVVRLSTVDDVWEILVDKSNGNVFEITDGVVWGLRLHVGEYMQIPPIAATPGAPNEGAIYADSTGGDKHLYYYDGTAWINATMDNYLDLTDTGAAHVADAVLYTNAGGTAKTESASFIFDGVALHVKGSDSAEIKLQKATGTEDKFQASGAGIDLASDGTILWNASLDVDGGTKYGGIGLVGDSMMELTDGSSGEGSLTLAHIETAQASDPTLSSCGTTPSIVGNDMAGVVTTGTGGVASCTVTFNVTWSTAPVCIAQDTADGELVYVSAQSTTAFTVTAVDGDIDASETFNYICIGR